MDLIMLKDLLLFPVSREQNIEDKGDIARNAMQENDFSFSATDLGFVGCIFLHARIDKP